MDLANAFEPGIFDEIDLEASLASSQLLQQTRENDIYETGSTLVDASYHALKRVPTVDSPGGAAWEAFRNTPTFARLQERADMGRVGTIASWMATVNIARYIEYATQQQEGEQEGEISQMSEMAALSDYDLAEMGQGAGNLEFEDSNGKPVVISGEYLESEADKADALHALVDQAGFSDEGESLPDRIKLAGKLSRNLNLEKLSKILGWAMPMAAAPDRDHWQSMVGKLAGYKLGEISPQMSSADRIGLQMGNVDTVKRAAEGALNIRKFERSEDLGKGPVIFLRDESSSTRNGAATIERDIRTLEMGLASIFRKQARDLICLRWSAGIDGHKPWRTNAETIRYTHGDSGLVEHMSASLNGMTSLARPLADALAVADEYVDGADIVVATDSLIGPEINKMAPALLEDFRKRGGRVWVIVVGEKRKQEDLAWADAVVSMNDLVADNVDLKAVVRSMIKR